MLTFRTDILPLKDALYRLALRITMNREEAEDVVQETLIKLWNRREQWNEIENIEAFAMTVCRNLALDHMKSRENQHVSLDDSEALPSGTVAVFSSPSPTPFDDAVNQDHLALVHQIISSLPEKQRSCIQLRDIEGKTYKEIAEILSISEEQVKVSIFRARQAIRDRFPRPLR